MQRPSQPQGKHWIATLPGVHDLDEALLRESGLVRAVWQQEIAPTTGMCSCCAIPQCYVCLTFIGLEHVQMYFSLAQRKRLSQVKALIGIEGHFEIAKASAQENFTYCTKEATRAPDCDPQHFGQFHMADAGRRTDITGLVELVRTGSSFNDILDDHPHIVPTLARSMRFFERLQRENTHPPQRPDIKYVYAPLRA